MSKTVTTAVHESILPPPSVAVTVTELVPRLEQSKLSWLYVITIQVSPTFGAKLTKSLVADQF